MRQMNDESDDVHLLAPFQYIARMPGKQVRSRLATAFNHWFDIDKDKMDAVMEMVEMLHNASLMWVN